MTNTGHGFLKPASSSAAGVDPSPPKRTAEASDVPTATTYAYPSMVPISVADGDHHTQGVALPVQHIIEGLLEEHLLFLTETFGN